MEYSLLSEQYSNSNSDITSLQNGFYIILNNGKFEKIFLISEMGLLRFIKDIKGNKIKNRFSFKEPRQVLNQSQVREILDETGFQLPHNSVARNELWDGVKKVYYINLSDTGVLPSVSRSEHVVPQTQCAKLMCSAVLLRYTATERRPKNKNDIFSVFFHSRHGKGKEMKGVLN